MPCCEERICMELRFVLSPEGIVTFDPSQRAVSVKEIYLTVDEFVSGSGADKLASLSGTVPDQIHDIVYIQARKHVLQLLSLLKKAGHLLLSTDAVRQGKPPFLYKATDAGADVQKRFKTAIPLMERDAIDNVLGRHNTVIIGVTDVKAAAALTTWIELMQALEKR